MDMDDLLVFCHFSSSLRGNYISSQGRSALFEAEHKRRNLKIE